jgi:hypothetical protein
MSRRAAFVLLGAFVLTRLVGAWLADHPDTYQGIVAGDLVLYEEKAQAILDEGGKPYGSVPLEYPPGALPLILGPEAIPDDPLSYRTGFILLLLAVDVLAFIGLWRLGRRWGSMAGPWLWVALVPSLGPLVYLRLDLLPAVATIWALERAAAKEWFSSGAALSFGAVAKIYPVLFFPVALWAASPRKRWLFCLGALWIVVPLIGFGDSLDDVTRAVLGYHSHRSIQVESTWATPLLIAMRNGYDSGIFLSFGAFHVEGGITPMLKTTANALSAIVVLFTTLLAVKRVKPGDAQQLAASMFMILLATMAVGLVFSPQFVIWLFALGGAVLSSKRSDLKLPILLLVPIAALTQAVYPFLYGGLLGLEEFPIFVVATRNVLILTTALLTIWRIFEARPVDQREEQRA